MRVLMIGGSGFIGSHVSSQLVAQGHQVLNFHRGQSANSRTQVANSSSVANDPEADGQRGSLQEIHGDKSELESMRPEFEKLQPDVVVDMIAMSEHEAQVLLRTFRGIAERLVVISSSDVYRNYDLMAGLDEAKPNASPLKEDGPLRTNLFRRRAGAKDTSDPAYYYEKILVEQTVLDNADLPARVLRLPAVYGPGDRQHRLFPYIKRMDDRRPAILMEAGMQNWRWTRGYVENVAAAISWAAGDQTPESRIYNVGESKGLPETDWIAQIADVIGWKGRVIGLESSELPPQMRSGLIWEYHLETDTSLIREQKGFCEPVDIREGIYRTVEWERANPPEVKPGDFDYKVEDEILERFGIN